MESAKRENLLFQVFQDRPIDTCPKVAGGLAFAAVERESGPDRLKRAGIEDQLRERSSVASSRARWCFGLLVRDLDHGSWGRRRPGRRGRER